MRVSSTEFQNNFGKYLEKCKHENIIITRNGKQKAILLPLPDEDANYTGESIPKYVTVRKDDRYVSYSKFREMCEASDTRMELIDGVVYMLPSPGFTHQHLAKKLLYLLEEFFSTYESCDVYFAPFDIELRRMLDREERDLDEEDVNVVQPDLMVLCDYIDDVDENDRYRGTPSLVIEILSPSNRGHDMIRKLGLYEETGIREYWVVDPARKSVTLYFFEEYTFKEYFGTGDSCVVQSLAFEGLSISYEDIFS